MNLDPKEHGNDIAFRAGELQTSNLLARRLSANPGSLVASPAYLEKQGFPKTPDDLKQHICLPFGNMRKWGLRDETGKDYSVIVKGPVSLNMGDAIGIWLRLFRHWYGLLLACRFIVENGQAIGHLQVLLGKPTVYLREQGLVSALDHVAGNPTHCTPCWKLNKFTKKHLNGTVD